MKTRSIVVGILAGITVACVFDARHVAPSTPGRSIPDMAMLEKDPRMALRAEIAIAGIVLGGGLLIIGFRSRPRRQDRAADGSSVTTLA